MSRNLKSLGLALMGVLALTAVAASSASAVNFHSGSTGPTTYITAENEAGQPGFQLDLANGANFKCSKSVYEGSYEGTTTSELTLTPTISGCLVAGQTTTVSHDDCKLTLTTPTTTAAKNTDEYHGVVHLICATGKITVSIGDPVVACTITVHPQALQGVWDYTDITTATPNQDDITINPTTGLSVAYTASGSVCGGNGTGKFTGTLTAKAYSNAAHTNQVDFWLD